MDDVIYKSNKENEAFEKEILPCSQILYFDVSDETMTARLLNNL